MKIIWLGIGPMIGTGGLFLSLLGLRPSRFRWKMSHRSHSHRLFWHTEITALELCSLATGGTLDHGDGSADQFSELRNCSLIRTIIDKK